MKTSMHTLFVIVFVNLRYSIHNIHICTCIYVHAYTHAYQEMIQAYTSCAYIHAYVHTYIHTHISGDKTDI